MLRRKRFVVPCSQHRNTKRFGPKRDRNADRGGQMARQRVTTWEEMTALAINGKRRALPGYGGARCRLAAAGKEMVERRGDLPLFDKL